VISEEKSRKGLNRRDYEDDSDSSSDITRRNRSKLSKTSRKGLNRRDYEKFSPFLEVFDNFDLFRLVISEEESLSFS
jgi:hypothetical protein